MPFETQPPLDQTTRANSGYQGQSALFCTQARTDSQDRNVCTRQDHFSARAANVTNGQVLGPCTPQLSYFAGSLLQADPVDFTTSEPGKWKVDSQTKAGENQRQEPREVLQGEALTHSQ